MEENRGNDGTAERAKLEEQMQNWDIKQRTIPLRNTEKVKLEVHLASNGMSKKTSINANTTAGNFCNPGETVTVKGQVNGSVVVPDGAKEVLIKNGSITVVL